MSQEMPPKIPVSEADLERYIDRPFDLVARVRAAKDAAQREVETFGNVSEYEIRKIYGQKSQLSYEPPTEEGTREGRPAPRGGEESPLTKKESKAAEPIHDQKSFDFEVKEPIPDEGQVKEG